MVCYTGFLANYYNGQMVFHYLLYKNTRIATVCNHLCESNFQAACPEKRSKSSFASAEHLLQLGLSVSGVLFASKPQAVLKSFRSQINEYSIEFQGYHPRLTV